MFASWGYKCCVLARQQYNVRIHTDEIIKRKWLMQEEQKRNQPWRPLPKSMLRRVSELATIYPYPRGRNFKLNSHVNNVSSPAYQA